MVFNNIKMFSTVRKNQVSVSLAPDRSHTLSMTDLSTCGARNLHAAHPQTPSCRVSHCPRRAPGGAEGWSDLLSVDGFEYSFWGNLTADGNWH